MKNISLNQEPLTLSTGSTYIVIDALYIDDIKSAIKTIKKQLSIEEITPIAFPYNKTALGEFVADTNIFDANRIKKIEYNAIVPEKRNTVSSDTGLLLFINKIVFWDFIEKFDYGSLVDSDISLINEPFLQSIIKDYAISDLALVSPVYLEGGKPTGGGGIYEIL